MKRLYKTLRFNWISYGLIIAIMMFSCRKAPELPKDTSKPDLPSVITNEITDIKSTTAICEGEVTGDGNLNIINRGVCWDTNSNPILEKCLGLTNDGAGVGPFYSEITGLDYPKTYFVTAYATNEKGNAYGEVKQFETKIPCGETTITINHVAGSVAPVTKTVTYGMVTNIPGETDKCWITSNLGSEQQATSVDDATEASAGWYWQFNLKQGYKHDSTTRTPGKAWISNINENSDWLAANDPCTIELGSGWRIPTYTEWNNVVNAGNWIDFYGPWNSELKLHAAGYLSSSNGSLYSRGSYGFYWSSSQGDNFSSRSLVFNSSDCNVYYVNKAYGRTLRCLRDTGDN